MQGEMVFEYVDHDELASSLSRREEGRRGTQEEAGVNYITSMAEVLYMYTWRGVWVFYDLRLCRL